MDYRCVLFDLDGTLIDSYDAITASVNHVRAFRGLPALPEPVVRKGVGHGILQLMADLLPGSDPAENARIYREHHPSVMFTHTRLLPGACELLEKLYEKQIPAVICSNKPCSISRELVKYLEISQFLIEILGPEDVPKPKPAPDMIIEALHRLKVERSEALYIGDMTIDRETARAAGVTVWLVCTGSNDWDTLEESKPDRLLRDLSVVQYRLFPVLIA